MNQGEDYEMYDIVYILKNDIDDTELCYSVRSVQRNFPFNKLWFAGGVPEHIKPDGMIPIQQTGTTKWEKVRNTLIEICKNDEITEDFWLFNDDFFIMQKVDYFPPAVRGTLFHHAQQLADKYGQTTKYGDQLRQTAKTLKANGFDRLDYALHVPMLINRQKALMTLLSFPGCPMFRSLYGNHHRIGGVIMEDVKIYDLKQKPTGEEIMLSTTNKSFHNGEVGKYIRNTFSHKCKYEKGI